MFPYTRQTKDQGEPVKKGVITDDHHGKLEACAAQNPEESSPPTHPEKAGSRKFRTKNPKRAHTVKPKGCLGQIPSRRGGNRLGKVVIGKGRKIPPAGVSTGKFYPAVKKKESKKKPTQKPYTQFRGGLRIAKPREKPARSGKEGYGAAFNKKSIPLEIKKFRPCRSQGEVQKRHKQKAKARSDIEKQKEACPDSKPASPAKCPVVVPKPEEGRKQKIAAPVAGGPESCKNLLAGKDSLAPCQPANLNGGGGKGNGKDHGQSPVE